jgi:hypothetical protein
VWSRKKKIIKSEHQATSVSSLFSSCFGLECHKRNKGEATDFFLRRDLISFDIFVILLLFLCVQVREDRKSAKELYDDDFEDEFA